MPTKALSCKKEAICEHGPEAPSCPVGQGSFKIDCFKVEKCSMVRRVQIWHSCWKSRISKASISDVMGVHKCIWYGQLACFGRHYECWKVYKGFKATFAALQMTVYFREGLVYFSRTMQNQIFWTIYLSKNPEKMFSTLVSWKNQHIGIISEASCQHE